MAGWRRGMGAPAKLFGLTLIGCALSFRTPFEDYADPLARRVGAPEVDGGSTRDAASVDARGDADSAVRSGPVVLLEGLVFPNKIWEDGQATYVSSAGDSVGDLWRVTPSSEGKPPVKVVSEGGVYDFRVTEGRIYWASKTAFCRILVQDALSAAAGEDAGVGRECVPVPPGETILNRAVACNDANYLFAVSQDISGVGSLWRVAKGDFTTNSLTLLYRGTHRSPMEVTAWQNQGKIFDDETATYLSFVLAAPPWNSEDDAGTDGGSGADGGFFTVYQTGLHIESDFHYLRPNVFFADPQTKRIHRGEPADLTPLETVYEESEGPLGVGIVGDRLFWTTLAGNIKYCDDPGGKTLPCKPKVFVHESTAPRNVWRGPTGTTVMWVTIGSDGHTGTLVEAPIP